MLNIQTVTTSKHKIGGIVYGIQKDVALKFVKNSELSEKVYKAASSAKNSMKG